MFNCLVKRYALVFVLLTSFFSSCTEPQKPLTSTEAIAFAGEIESSIKKGESTFLDNAFDKDEFIKKLDLGDYTEGNEFAEGVISKLNLGTQLTTILNDQDNFNFIKHYEKDGRHHVVFRLFTTKDGSLNYHDYELIKSGKACKIADAYIYLSGETLAETMHGMYANLYKKSLKNSNSLGGLNDLKEIKDLLNRGKVKEAKDMYEALPASLKKNKTVLLINVFICSRLTEEEYNTAINEFNRLYPNQPNMNLMMIDGYFIQKDYVKMLGAVNALDTQINTDPLLDYYRYLSYKLLLKQDSGIICLNRLVKNMPDFQSGYIELISAKLQEGLTAQADSLIKVYRSKPAFNQQDLNELVSLYK
jgi:hypothetical protein